ncbi:outer membrane beta-barrel protein [Acidobacterium sp. S8]|uniref:outer membrane beta-barrel protein n=1 Tax=Acidobacterium sp. S8 TaxID=1641854 RepID=UPI00131C0EF2|nr:outer membrane beta-barrel protein [Acidobacterium sp. S8]
MVVSCSLSRKLSRPFAIAVTAIALASFPIMARAQSDTPGHFSSSDDNKSYLSGEDIDGASLTGDPNPSPKPQYGQTNGGYQSYESRWSKLAFEAGGGFTAPVGNTSHGWETYGYNLKLGGGWNFTKHIGALLEYQFNRDKIPGSTLTQLAIDSGSNVPLGGNVNTWSITLDPIFYLPVTPTTGAYITGGGGFYRKVTNFTAPVLGISCYYYCYEGYYPTTVAHSSSNQGGLNIGAGFYWKAFGPDSKAKLFTEARYTWVDSPIASSSDPYGSGTSSLIPVTFGIRF